MDLKLKKAIKESGNNLHLEVAEFLEELGWGVDLSAYYCDDITDKPREIDILATKKISVYEGNCPERYKFYLRLLIECKHFKNEIAFRVCKNNINNSRSAICNQAQNIDVIKVFGNNEPEEKHHYLAEGKIAKLYDTVKSNKEKTQEEVFQAITRPIKSLIFFKKRFPGEAIYYPVVVYRGTPGFYVIEKSKNEDKDLGKLKQIKNIIFGLKYSYKANQFGNFRTDYFCVDFIHQEKFEEHLKMIEDKEINEIRDYLRRCYNEERGVNL